jgi:N-acetylglucosaminyl-diphospho-decaprenol L-rhamnosyltransferase
MGAMRTERTSVTTERDVAPSVDPTLGCVTVSYRSGEALADLIESIDQSSLQPSLTVVVNNARDDNLEPFSTRCGVRVVASPRNVGYGTAVNAGVRELSNEVEWVLVTNPDVRLDSNALERLLATARQIPGAGAVGPQIRDADGTVYPSARELPSLRTGIGHALFANIWPGNPWTRRYRGENRVSSGTWRSTGWLSGSCLLVRRSIFDRLGGFDETYFMYFEDVDLGKRVAEAGLVNVYEPAAKVIHTGAHSTASAAHSMREVHHQSAYQYLARKYPAWYLWPLRAILRIGLAVRARFTRRF